MIHLNYYCRFLLTGIFILVLLQNMAYAQDQSFIIYGKIDPSRKQEKVHIWYPDPTNMIGVKDSAVIKDGHFIIKGTAKIPGKAVMYTKPDHSGIELYIEPDTILINSTGSLSVATITGAELNKDFGQLVKMLKTVSEKRSDVYKAYDIAKKTLTANSDNKELEKNLEKQLEAVRIERKNIYKNFIQKMPASIVSIEAVKSVGGFTPDVRELTALFEGLAETVQTSPSGVYYKNTITKLARTSIGAVAPDFAQADTAGKLVSLKDFQGKYVFVDFWASWCGPCRAEHPELTKVFNKYKNHNFTMIGISLDQSKNREAWLKAIAKDKLVWTQLSDLKGWANEVSTLYNVEAIPKNYLIGPDGIIVAIDLKPEALNEKLAQLLSNNH